MVVTGLGHRGREGRRGESARERGRGCMCRYDMVYDARFVFKGLLERLTQVAWDGMKWTDWCVS